MFCFSAIEYDHVLSLEEHAEAVTEREVAMETNAQQSGSESCNGNIEKQEQLTPLDIVQTTFIYQTSV